MSSQTKRIAAMSEGHDRPEGTGPGSAAKPPDGATARGGESHAAEDGRRDEQPPRRSARIKAFLRTLVEAAQALGDHRTTRR